MIIDAGRMREVSTSSVGYVMEVHGNNDDSWHQDLSPPQPMGQFEVMGVVEQTHSLPTIWEVRSHWTACRRFHATWSQVALAACRSITRATTIGGTTAADRNVLSGIGAPIRATFLFSASFIGTDATGTQAMTLYPGNSNMMKAATLKSPSRVVQIAPLAALALGPPMSSRAEYPSPLTATIPLHLRTATRLKTISSARKPTARPSWGGRIRTT